MRIPFAFFFIAIIEAKRKYPKSIIKTTPDEELPLPKKVNEYPEHFNLPVQFGHIYKDGYGDPRSNLKSPIDLVELHMKTPRNYNESREILKKGNKNIQWISKERPRILGSPKDAYIDEKTFRLTDEVDGVSGKSNGSRSWFDWVSIQQSNIATLKPKQKTVELKSEINRYDHNESNSKIKGQYFASNSFDLTRDIRENKINLTTCSEFARGADFHPKDIVDIDWVPFYVWSSRFHMAIIYRFSYPTKKLVKKYKEEFGMLLNKNLDWDQPKLVMNEMLEMLLIAADRTGLFHAIPYQDLPQSIKRKKIQLPTITIRFKIIDPYLAMMYCDEDFTTLMAVAGNEPTTNKDKISEAKTLKIKGTGYPVSRDVELENMRAKAEKDWEKEKEERKFIKIKQPIIRNHFFGSER